MAESTVTTPYATALPFIVGSIPSWLDEYNAQRLASYDLYDDMFDNAPDTTRLMLRGTDEKPIYVPTAKRLINMLARYVGKGWGYVIDPETGTPDEQQRAKEEFSKLFARERMLSLFNTGKREWLRRGDWIWYILADPEKPEGRRISIRNVDPRTFFPLTDELDPDRVNGAMIVEEIVLEDGKTLALSIQRWLKPYHPEHPSPDGEEIAYDKAIYDIVDWQDPDKRKLLQTPQPLDVLPGVTAIPLYHIRNNGSTGNPFGESELKGLESIVAGINQAISDEDLALAMAGLGMYVTDSGAPVDPATKEPTSWLLGPQMVVEVGVGRNFTRVGGIDDVTPTQDHVKYLEEQVYGNSGVNEIALGTRGAVQESGVALAIRMSPLFDVADDKDLEINSVLTQMFYDLAHIYFPVYEGVSFGEVVITSETDTGNRLPFDRAQRWQELLAGYEAGIFSLAFVHRVLVDEFGYELSADDLEAAMNEASARAQMADPFAARVDQELTSDDADEDGAAA